MSASPDNRLSQLEQQVRLLLRELARVENRLANPLTPRLGRHLAFLKADLPQGGTADVELLAFSAGVQIRTGIIVNIRDQMLNLGESIPETTKIWIVWDKTLWTWISAYCRPSNTIPEEEEE